MENTDWEKGSLSTSAAGAPDWEKGALAEPLQKPGLIRGAGDSAIALASGVAQGGKMLTDVAGADNAASGVLGKATDALTDLESPYRKAEKQARAEKIKQADDSGSTWEQVKAYTGAFADAPLDTSLNALGTSIPTLAAGLVTGGGAAAGIAARAAQVGIGAAQGVGGIKGQIHESVKQKHLEAGATEADATQRADAAQAYSGPNAGSIALGGALGAVAGSTGAESAVRRLAGQRVAGGAADTAAPGIVRSAATGVARETPMEMLQGGQERFASNTALQGEGFDVPNMQGVVGQAALEGLASAPMGGGFGAIEGVARQGLAQRQGEGAAAFAAGEARTPPDSMKSVAAKAQWVRGWDTARAQASASPAPAPAADGGVSGAPGAQSPEASGVAGTVDAAQAPGAPADTVPLNWETGTSSLAQQIQSSVQSAQDLVAQAMKPSEQMGLDPNAGPLSAAAVVAVDSGASDQVQVAAQQEAVQAQESREPAPKPAAAAAAAADPETGEVAPADRAQQLQQRLQFIEQQARTNGGWDMALVTARDAARAELAAMNPPSAASGQSIGARGGGGTSAAQATARAAVGVSAGTTGTTGTAAAAPPAPAAPAASAAPGRSAGEQIGQLETTAASAEALAADWSSRQYKPNSKPLPKYEAAGGPADVQEANEQRRLKEIVSAKTAASDARAQADTLRQQGNVQAQQAAKAARAVPTAGERGAKAIAEEGAARRLEQKEQADLQAELDAALAAGDEPDADDNAFARASEDAGPIPENIEIQSTAPAAVTPPGGSKKGPANVAQAPQAQQAKTQQPQAGGAQTPRPAAAPGLNNAAPTVDNGPQAESPPGAQAQAAPETREQRAQRVADAGAAWTRMPTVEREALAQRTDVKPILRKNLPRAQWGSLNADVQRKLADAMQPASASAETPAAAPASDRDHFTLQRANDAGDMVSVTFARGDTIKVATGQKPYSTGVITGISHADRKFKVDSREHGVDFGYAYPESYDEFAAPRAEVDKGLDALAKRLDDGSAIQSEGFIDSVKAVIERHNLGDYAKARMVELSARAAGITKSVADKARATRERNAAEEAAARETENATPRPPIQMTMEEWKATHKDAKSIIDGKRAVLREGGMRSVEITKPKSVPAKVKEFQAARADYFTPGNIVKSYGGHDRVIAYTPLTDSGVWSVTVRAVRKDGDAWVEVPNEPERSHSTQPDAKAIKAGPVARAPAIDTDDAVEPVGLLDRHNAVERGISAGTLGLEQYQQTFAVLMDDEAATMAELGKLTKDDLLRSGGPNFAYRYKGEKKDAIVKAAYNMMLDTYAMGRQYGNSSFVMSAAGMRAHEQAQSVALRELVTNTTQEDLATRATEVKAARDDFAARREAAASALQNPKTLQDFRGFMRHWLEKGESADAAFLRLTPEQRQQYDVLEAESSREAREKAKANARKADVRSAGATSAGEIIATKHTKHGHDLYVLQLADRVEREDYETLNTSARRLGGSYNSFRGNGAIPGFQFRNRDAAEAFQALVAGDTAAAQEVAQARRDAFEDDKSQTAVERLRSMADAIDAGADAQLATDRKTNTARRARMAGAAEEAARSGKAYAGTMRNLADAIEAGKAPFLDGVRTKTQLSQLQQALGAAKAKQLYEKYGSWSAAEEHEHDPLDDQTVDFAEFPRFSMYRSDLAGLARQLMQVDGGKKTGAVLAKVADDVSDAYTDWAKANLLQVSQFGRADQLADFASRDDAERAIKRSGLVSKAVVLPIKRGQNRVVLSPGEAMQRGLWKGDGDKRINLSMEFVQDLVKLGKRRGSKAITIPWQLESTLEKRQRLQRMGLLTPAEYRSALRELVVLREEKAAPDRIKELERSMVGRANDGLDFFPTGAAATESALDAADIQPDMEVLEPSAGMGHVADAIREQAGVEPDVVEMSRNRRELLEAKGYNLVGTDFLEVTGKQYDRIVMNPPFSDGRDVQHVRHAFSLLKPGGRIVAIMSESAFFQSNKRAEAFRDWLDTMGATNEKLPDGSFMDSRLPVNTSVSARMVVIDKPEAGDVVFSTTATKPAQGVTVQRAQEIGDRILNDLGIGSVARLKAVGDPADAGFRVPVSVVPQGGLRDGQIYLFADNISDEVEAFKVVVHELFHLGLSKSVEQGAYIQTMLGFLSDPKVREYAQLWKGSADGISRRNLMPANNWHALAVEEALSDIAEDMYSDREEGVGTKLQGWATRIVSRLARLAEKLGLNGVAQRIRAFTRTQAEDFVMETLRRAGDTGEARLRNARFSRVAEQEAAAGPGMNEDLAQQLLRIMGQPPEISPATQAQAVARVRKTVDAIRGAWANGPEVVVAFDMNDPAVPADARAEDLKQRSGGAAGAPEGFYWKGKTYLLASQLATPNDAARVLFHESLGHHGLRGAFGKDLDNILNQVASMRPVEVDAKIAEYGLRGDRAADRRVAAEEVLAEMAEATPQLHFVKRAIAAIRNWLRAKVPGFRSLAMSDADIIQAFILPARRYVEQGALPAGGVPALAFSRSEQAPLRYAVTFAEAREAAKAFQGKKIANGQTGLQAVVSRNSLDKMLSSKAVSKSASAAAHSTAVANVDSLFQNAIWGWSKTDRADNTNIAAIHRFFAPMVFEGREVMAKVTVKETVDANHSNPIYTVEAVDFNEKAPAAQWVDASAKADGFDLTSIRSAGDVLSLAEGIEQRNRGEGTAAMFSRSKLGALKSKALEQIHQTLSHPGTVSVWDRSVGTMRNLAERVPAFKPVFEAAQQFIDDVSTLANEAADAAPRLLPRVDSWKDLKKQPISAADNKAVAAPIFEGTLMWARDVDGTAVLVDGLAKKYANLAADEKAQLLLRAGRLDDGVLKMWRGLPVSMYEANINSRFESQMLKAGVVWTDQELKSIFKANDHQISLYREARAGIDRSLDITTRADMLRALGEDYADLRDLVMDQANLEDAMKVITDVLQRDSRAAPQGDNRIADLNNLIVTRYEQSKKLMDEGYAPLSRFGRYTVDVVDAAGERQYFGMYETKREANQAALQMKAEFKGSTVEQGTMSDQAFKLFQGITPESLQQFANILNAGGDGDAAQDKVFQEYLKLAKNNHSALKRLIHRKGIAGYSEDVGRVLASFVYSNARLAAGGLNAGTLESAVQAIPKEQGELRDVAMRLRSYIQDPQEEGQAVRGMLFAQYLGGSVASAMVNMTQPFAVTLPWLSQHGGIKNAGAQMARALKDMSTRGFKYEKDLALALQAAEDDGTVSPQEVHQLMAQARGAGGMRSGDGTRKGDALARAGNAWEKTKVAWGQPFALAEQFNRRSTFIAAYRTAKEKGLGDPGAFARKAVLETQFLYSKANKMRWARGAVGGTLMTFKTYSVSYLELMHRMWNQGGPEGKRAVGWSMAMLMLMGGAGGLPFMEDAEDLIDGAGQLMGYNLSTKQWRKQLLRDVLGKELAQFMDSGLSGLPGAPIDVSGRLGMGNLLPGTGLFLSKQNRERDLMEIAGPAGDLVARGFTGARKLLTGDIAGAAVEVSPTAVRNALKGADMAASGIYKDTKGYKVIDTTLSEAASKFLGFQPRSVAEVQEANSFMQRSKSFYSQSSAEIKAQWADALFRKDDAALQQVRERLAAWNRNNPGQPIVVKMPDVWKRVHEMGKDRTERIADTAPKALRAQMREAARDINS